MKKLMEKSNDALFLEVKRQKEDDQKKKEKVLE